MGPILGQNLDNVWVTFHFPSGTSLQQQKSWVPPGDSRMVLFMYISSVASWVISKSMKTIQGILYSQRNMQKNNLCAKIWNLPLCSTLVIIQYTPPYSTIYNLNKASNIIEARSICLFEWKYIPHLWRQRKMLGLYCNLQQTSHNMAYIKYKTLNTISATDKATHRNCYFFQEITKTYTNMACECHYFQI